MISSVPVPEVLLPVLQVGCWEHFLKKHAMPGIGGAKFRISQKKIGSDSDCNQPWLDGSIIHRIVIHPISYTWYDVPGTRVYYIVIHPVPCTRYQGCCTSTRCCARYHNIVSFAWVCAFNRDGLMILFDSQVHIFPVWLCHCTRLCHTNPKSPAFHQ